MTRMNSVSENTTENIPVLKTCQFHFHDSFSFENAVGRHFMGFHKQVEVFWVVTPCSIVVGYQCFRGPQHYTASQPRRSQLEMSLLWKPQYLYHKQVFHGNVSC